MPTTITIDWNVKCNLAYIKMLLETKGKKRVTYNEIIKFLTEEWIREHGKEK